MNYFYVCFRNNTVQILGEIHNNYALGACAIPDLNQLQIVNTMKELAKRSTCCFCCSDDEMMKLKKENYKIERKVDDTEIVHFT